MTNPAWLNEIFAALMMAIAAYGAGRLVAARRWSRPTHQDVDVAHILMGTAMAGMLVSDLDPVPIGTWEAVFSALAAWWVWRCLQLVRGPGGDRQSLRNVHRLSRRLIHLVMALAMLYMYLAALPAVAGSGGSMAMGAATGATSDFVLVPLVFIVVLFASAIWELDRIGHLNASRAPESKRSPVSLSVGSGPSIATGNSRSADESVGDDPSVRWLAPRLEGACHIAMCVTMGYMLVLML